MYYDFKVKIPEVKGKIYERTIKGVVYINYEYDRIYKPDKKYNIPKRTTIGKKCEDDPEMMYPNPNLLSGCRTAEGSGKGCAEQLPAYRDMDRDRKTDDGKPSRQDYQWPLRR